jgi:Na+/phosphate symporter
MFKGDTNPDIGLLLYSLTSVYFISYFFFGVSLVISTFLKKVKNVISLSLGLTFLLYSLNAFTQAIESDSNFSWNPYTLFEFNQIYMDEKIAFGAIAYVLGVLAVATAVSFIRYQKHNISSL